MGDDRRTNRSKGRMRDETWREKESDMREGVREEKREREGKSKMREG